MLLSLSPVDAVVVEVVEVLVSPFPASLPVATVVEAVLL